jgi:anti-anti-sigma regulatory factor
MATNFKVSTQESKSAVQLNLRGDFDGSSAQQLLYCLSKYCDTGRSIVIDTTFLRNCDAFGLNLFRYHLDALNRQAEIVAFTGSKAHVFDRI